MKLSEITGQSMAIEILRQALKTGRIPNAFLFTGVSGTGKAATAHSFAESLFCQNTGDNKDACGECPSCRKMARGSHSGWIQILPDGNYIKIEQIREILQEISLKPFDGNRIIIFIDEAEKLTTGAANALLKTLEEPPSSVCFILSTSSPTTIPATISSRCQTIRFVPLPFDASALESLKNILFPILKKLNDASPAGRLESAADLASYEDEVKAILSLTKDWYRDLLIFSATRNAEMLIHKDYVETFREIRKKTSTESILNALRRITDVEKSLSGNINRQLALENLFLNLP